MKINMYGKCDNCGKYGLPIIEIQDTSSYGDWIGLCIHCLQSAQQMLSAVSENLSSCWQPANR
jgi:hypothetical protein